MLLTSTGVVVSLGGYGSCFVLSVAAVWVLVVIVVFFGFFFFFQAEDGIRDWSVTGVQTCALPISKRLARRGVFSGGSVAAVLASGSSSGAAPPALVASTIKAATLVTAGRAAATGRSEERRVGKECRARWWA